MKGMKNMKIFFFGQSEEKRIFMSFMPFTVEIIGFSE